MKFISEKDNDVQDTPIFEPKIRRRSIREVVTVCPKCFSPTKLTSGLFNRDYSCTNEECNWVGTLAIEVSRDDYEVYAKEKNQNQ